MDNPYDKAGRFAAKLNPVGFYDWLLRGPTRCEFSDWLDTRTIPYPGEADRTCDTVARINRRPLRKSPLACVTEFLSEIQADVLERLLEYAIRLRRELRYGRKRRGRFQVIGSLVNMTGAMERHEFCMDPEEIDEAGLSFRVVMRNLCEEDAAATLNEIHQKRTARCILPWIPLMSGGDESDIIDRWKRIAGRERSAQRRSDYAALAVVFAELAGIRGLWKEKLEGWNMIQSQQVLEWQAEAAEATRLEAARQSLLRLIELRFSKPPSRSMVKKVESTDDLEQLNQWFAAAATASDQQTFLKRVNGK